MTSLIVAAVEDGVGVVVLVNADSKDESALNIVLKAAEIAFGSTNTSSSPPPATSSATPPALPSTIPRSTLPRHAGVAARAFSPGTPPSLDLAGTYYSTGYGAIVLCNMQSSGPSCESVLDDFRAFNKSLSSDSTDLFASYDSPWTSHVQLTYTNASQYLMYLGTVYPEGYGKNSTPFSTLEPTTIVQFVVENEEVVGFGLNDTVDSDLTHGGSVEETSQVWFVKQA